MSLVTKITPISNTDDIGVLSSKDLNLHDCLTDDADWNNEYWDFNSDCVGNFKDIIRNTYEASTKGISFQAIWAGEKPESSIELTIEQLINTIKSNKVKTQAVYIVYKNA